MSLRSDWNRRRVLGAVAGAGALGVAGCVGDDSDVDQEPDPEEETDPGGDDEQEETDPREDGEFDAVGFPDDGECAVCNMIAAEYPEWNAQLVHESEERAYFCSPGCLVTYVPHIELFDGPDTPIEGAWVSEFEAERLIDAVEAYWVYEQDRERQEFPMPMGSPLPFGDEDAATVYIDDHESLTVDDHLLRWEDLDEDVAEFYRQPRIEEVTEE